MPADFGHTVLSVDSLIGKTVLSLTSGNKIGEVSDLVIDPLAGSLLGLIVQLANGGAQNAIIAREIYSLGADAVMARGDRSTANLSDSSISSYPLARKNITGAKIITEGGKLLGEVASVYVDTASSPIAIIYEVRESLLDKLLRRAVFIPASAGLAVSDNAERIIVPNEVLKDSAGDVHELNSHLAEPDVAEKTLIRGRRTAAMQAFRQGVIEITETGEEAVVNKQPRVIEEVVVSREVAEHAERVSATVRKGDVEVERIEGKRSPS